MKTKNSIAEPDEKCLSDWLEEVIGHWDFKGISVGVFRPGRFVMASYETATCEPVDFECVILSGRRIGEIKTSLEEHPVQINASLLHCWLTPVEREKYRGAGHVQSGRTVLLNLIEKRMNDWDRLVSEVTGQTKAQSRGKRSLEKLFQSLRKRQT